jgi:hypothetical protein
MPIQFRCPACDRMLGIARRKAGSVVKCPRCAADVQVPLLAGIAVTTNGPLGAAPPIPRPTPAVAVKGVKGEPRRESQKPESAKSAPRLDSLPLFERPDFESLLTPTAEKTTNSNEKAQPESARVTNRENVSNTDDSLDVVMVPNVLTVSRGQLTLAVMIVAILLGVSFASGWILASATGKVSPPVKSNAEGETGRP